MINHPTARELLEAAQEHLATRVVPALTDSRLRFETLVAAHVLGVVARELERGEAHAFRHWTETTVLLGREDPPPRTAAGLRLRRGALDEALCAAIREGRFDDRDATEALLGVLARQLEDALEVWNPAFLARVRAGSEG